MYRNVHDRTHLIAGKVSIGQSYHDNYIVEPCTTIAEKSRYDGLTTQGLTVHAEKHPNVIPRP